MELESDHLHCDIAREILEKRILLVEAWGRSVETPEDMFSRVTWHVEAAERRSCKKEEVMAETAAVRRAEVPMKPAKYGSVFDQIQDTFDALSRRAYEIFEGNGRALGRDWEAEKEERRERPSVRRGATTKSCGSWIFLPRLRRIR